MLLPAGHSCQPLQTVCRWLPLLLLLGGLQPPSCCGAQGCCCVHALLQLHLLMKHVQALLLPQVLGCPCAGELGFLHVRVRHGCWPCGLHRYCCWLRAVPAPSHWAALRCVCCWDLQHGLCAAQAVGYLALCWLHVLMPLLLLLLLGQRHCSSRCAFLHWLLAGRPVAVYGATGAVLQAVTALP